MSVHPRMTLFCVAIALLTGQKEKERLFVILPGLSEAPIKTNNSPFCLRLHLAKTMWSPCATKLFLKVLISQEWNAVCKLRLQSSCPAGLHQPHLNVIHWLYTQPETDWIKPLPVQWGFGITRPLTQQSICLGPWRECCVPPRVQVGWAELYPEQ